MEDFIQPDYDSVSKDRHSRAAAVSSGSSVERPCTGRLAAPCVFRSVLGLELGGKTGQSRQDFHS